MSRAGKVGLAGGLLGLVATGAAVGLAAERYAVGRARLRPDPDEGEPFFALPADRATRSTADDGVPLHVEEVGDPDAPLTVVFCHGYTQQLAAWHFQRRDLAGDRRGWCSGTSARTARSGRSAPRALHDRPARPGPRAGARGRPRRAARSCSSGTPWAA